MSFSSLMAHLFLSLNSPLFGYSTVCLSILLIKNILVASLEMSLIVTTLEEARGAAEHSAVHRTTLQQRISQLRLLALLRVRSPVLNTS